MNLKICKKCLNKKTLVFTLYKENLGGTYLDFINFNGKNYCEYLLSSYLYKKKDLNSWNKNPEKYCHIDNDCPYYIEHQISDWSEKNDR